MSELTLMAEAIRDSMHAVAEAQNVREELRANNNHSAFDALRSKLLVLEERLQKLKMVLDNEEAYAMDELMDALSKVYSDHRADYRRTPRMAEV